MTVGALSGISYLGISRLGSSHLGIPFLADNDFGDDLGDGVAGPIGLLIIILLVIATVFLIRNMNARLRRLPDKFPDPRGAAREPGGASDGEADTALAASPGSVGVAPDDATPARAEANVPTNPAT